LVNWGPILRQMDGQIIWTEIWTKIEIA